MGVKSNYQSMNEAAPDEDLEFISEEIQAEDFGDDMLNQMKQEIDSINQRINSKTNELGTSHFRIDELTKTLNAQFDDTLERNVSEETKSPEKDVFENSDESDSMDVEELENILMDNASEDEDEEEEEQQDRKPDLLREAHARLKDKISLLRHKVETVLGFDMSEKIFKLIKNHREKKVQAEKTREQLISKPL